MRTLKAAIAVFVVSATAFVSAPSTSALTNNQIEAQLATRTFNIINNQRAARGLPRLARLAVVDRQAKAHTVWLANNRYGEPAFGNKDPHQGFSGRANRINAAIGISGACENVAMASGYTDWRQVPRVFFGLWKNSPPHNACLFNKAGFRANGGGIAFEKRGRKYYSTFIAVKN